MNFHHFVTDVLRKGHVEPIFLLLELEARFREESLDVFKLGVIFMFVFDFAVKGFCQFLSGSLDGFER